MVSLLYRSRPSLPSEGKRESWTLIEMSRARERARERARAREREGERERESERERKWIRKPALRRYQWRGQRPHNSRPMDLPRVLIPLWTGTPIEKEGERGLRRDKKSESTHVRERARVRKRARKGENASDRVIKRYRSRARFREREIDSILDEYTC